MKRRVLRISLCGLLLLPGLLFAAGSQEPPDLTAPVSVDMWHAMGGARIQLIEGIVQDFMNQNPNINVVHTINEPAAAGAYEALKAVGRENDVLIVSVDGGCPGVQNVADGVIGATSQH